MTLVIWALTAAALLALGIFYIFARQRSDERLRLLLENFEERNEQLDRLDELIRQRDVLIERLLEAEESDSDEENLSTRRALELRAAVHRYFAAIIARHRAIEEQRHAVGLEQWLESYVEAPSWEKKTALTFCRHPFKLINENAAKTYPSPLDEGHGWPLEVAEWPIIEIGERRIAN